jgi:hypothetical protein
MLVNGSSELLGRAAAGRFAGGAAAGRFAGFVAGAAPAPATPGTTITPPQALHRNFFPAWCSPTL